MEYYNLLLETMLIIWKICNNERLISINFY